MNRFSTKDRRQAFRMSKEWKDFRRKVRRAVSHDQLTGEKLRHDWNLHHMDLRTENYGDMSAMDRFRALNMDTHKFVHWAYRLWKKDGNFMFNVMLFLLRMADMSGQERWSACTHNKTSRRYYVLSRFVTNCTNKDDGMEMVLYCNERGQLFVRESAEFDAKFSRDGGAGASS